MFPLAVVMLIAAAPTSRALAASPPESVATAHGEDASTSLPVLGAMVAVGAPDGAIASLIYRPAPFLRTELGGGYNLISKGIRAGVSVLPFGAGPSATLEAGRFFEGDANGIARQVAGASFGGSAALRRIGYDFVNAHLGLDFGSRRVTFFLHAGMSFIRGSVHNLNEQLSASSDANSGTTVTINQDPRIRIFAPSAKLGLIFYIW
jgi:hypothetical protein